MSDPAAAPRTHFEPSNGGPVLARFDLPDSFSDGGAVLLPARDARFGPKG